MIQLLHPFSLRARWLGWALLCPWLAFAQYNDQGALKLNGQITSETCRLVMSETNDISNSPNSSLTLKLGTVPLTTAQAAAVGATFGQAKTVYFFSQSSSPTLNNFACPTGATFDIGLAVPSDKVLNTGSQSLLLSNGTVSSGAVGGVALSLKSRQSAFSSGNFEGDTALNLTQPSAFGVLLSGNADIRAPIFNLGNQRVYALTAQFAKTSNTVTAGAYASTIVVNMWWR